jgi:hypothetical protein
MGEIVNMVIIYEGQKFAKVYTNGKLMNLIDYESYKIKENGDVAIRFFNEEDYSIKIVRQPEISIRK